MSLTGRNILLGVSAGIAAYKSCELVRRLLDAGAQVRVVMTPAATQFVTPLTFQALSGHPVRTQIFDAEAEMGMDHISLARWADVVLVAPATADLMARVAHGLADDLLATLCLATRAPLYLAPAMNQVMWAAAATQDNLRLLQQRGARILGPGIGGQACGETGPGRMLEPHELVQALQKAFMPTLFCGEHLLITAGPTREPLDPVRYLSNHSSGRMGHALAQAAAQAGARVSLISGPVCLPEPPGVERILVETALDMHAAVIARARDADIFIGTAAVADYRSAAPLDRKIKKTGEQMSLSLVRNPDILADVAALQHRPFTVGFAAETEDVESHARDKLERKGLDMIAANDVSHGQGFGDQQNALLVLWPGGSRQLPRQGKSELARALLELIAERFRKDDIE